MTFQEQAKSTFPEYMKSEGNIARLYKEIFLSLVVTTKELGKSIFNAVVGIGSNLLTFIARLFALITLPLFFILIFWMEWKAIKLNWKHRMEFMERNFPECNRIK